MRKYMASLPDYRPRQLSLGPLEEEIYTLVWELGTATVKAIHDRILSDPDRELAYTSVTTVLNRLTKKGWLSCDKSQRSFTWRALLSPQEAQSLRAHQQLQSFLSVGNADIVATFADSLDQASVEQLSEIAQRIQAARQAREE